MPGESSSERIRKTLNHPVVDGDGHWLEPFPVFMDYLTDVAGARFAQEFHDQWDTLSGRNWYQFDDAGRQRNRITRQPWWTTPANTLDRSTGLIPSLLNERLHEFGVDFALIYPSLGLSAYSIRDEDKRRNFARALNRMASELFQPYAHNMTPAAVVTAHTPQEGIEELEYAVKTLRMKTIMISGWVRRPYGADKEWQPDDSRRRSYIESIAHDSSYDYDPFWAKCVELKVAVTSHIGSMGWADRTSPTSFVANHLGHFAQSHHYFARSLIMGGVVERFPTLNFGFLEGGAGWACNLLLDLVSHWKKRNTEAMRKYLMPNVTDMAEMRHIFETHATHPRYRDKIEAIVTRNVTPMEPSRSAEELTTRDRDSDEFNFIDFRTPDDIRRVFSENFYLGCEADDPTTAWAFNRQINKIALRPMFSSDITHFDVPDMTQVLEEAHELLDNELITKDQFKSFTFSNIVQLHGRMNPDFFKGTSVEAAATEELARSRPATAAAE